LENQGRRPYRIPPGGSNGIGILGYVRAYEEIRAFTADTRTDFDRIYLAGGSGGTHAGLLAGIQHFGDDTAVVGVNVTPYDDVEMRRKILRNVHQANDELDVDLEEIETRIDIRSGYLGPGYATPSEDDLRTIVEVGSKEGLVLDTCYTAKAFRCFLEEAEPGATNLFVHTGGSYGLFPLREQVRRAVAKFGSSEGDESSTF
jgi:D-cysteine desulfhydrase